MTFPRWDRIYFFAFSATVFAALGYLVLLFVPLIERVSSTDGEPNVHTRLTLLASGQVVPVLLSLLPVVVTASTLLALPRDRQPGRTGKVNLWLSTFLVYVFVVISIWSVGILFAPSAILLTAAAVGSLVRRRGPGSRTAQESKSGRGGGKRRPG